jgi:hypothetical protein
MRLCLLPRSTYSQRPLPVGGKRCTDRPSWTSLRRAACKRRELRADGEPVGTLVQLVAVVSFDVPEGDLMRRASRNQLLPELAVCDRFPFAGLPWLSERTRTWDGCLSACSLSITPRSSIRALATVEVRRSNPKEKATMTDSTKNTGTETQDDTIVCPNCGGVQFDEL